jgi:hypothetical protein
MSIQSTRRNPSLPRRTPAKTKVIAQPEVPAIPHDPQFPDIDMPSSDMFYKGMFTPPPPGGWPGGAPPWKMGPASPAPSVGGSTYTPPPFGGYTPTPTSIPAGAAGISTSTMRSPSGRTYAPAYSGGYITRG